MSVNITDGESTHFPLTGVYPVYIYIFLIHDLRASPRLTVFFSFFFRIRPTAQQRVCFEGAIGAIW